MHQPTDTASTRTPNSTLEEGLEQFSQSLRRRNRSSATLRAYLSDVRHFIRWVHENNVVITTPAEVERADIYEYLSFLSQQDLTGVSRARKLAAIREYFRTLVAEGLITESPAEGMPTPKKERNGRTWLSTDEYTRMLSLAGSSPRDFAILEVFLQTGVRVSELCALTLSDIDLDGHILRINSGKGMVGREIDLEKKCVGALKNWLAVRPTVDSDRVFLNYEGEPLGERGVRKLVVKYRVSAGIKKKASCHSLRHTFATYKAEQGVSPFQLQEWLGHTSLATTQIYVHMGRQNARKTMEATSL